MAKEIPFDLEKLTRDVKQQQKARTDSYGRREVRQGEVLATINHSEASSAREVSPEELRRIVSRFK